MLGKPVWTTMTLSPLGRVFSVTGKGKISPAAAGAGAAAVFLGAALVEVFFWAMTSAGTRASRIAARARNRVMNSPLRLVGTGDSIFVMGNENRAPSGAGTYLGG